MTPNKDMPELKECPFCGNSVPIYQDGMDGSDTKGQFFIYLSGHHPTCGLHGRFGYWMYLDKIDAINHWNTRAAQSPKPCTDAKIDALVKALEEVAHRIDQEKAGKYARWIWEALAAYRKGEK